MPTIKQLTYLVAVHEAGTFRKAAQRLGISQPTLTAQVNTLEEKLATNLFERSRKGTHLTPGGRAILPHVESILAETTAIRKLAARASGDLVGTYGLGIPPTLGPYLLPEVLPAIRTAFPEMKLYVQEKAPRDLELGLVHREFDFIITTLPTEIPDLTFELLFDEALMLVCAPDHPFAKITKVLPGQLRNESLLAIEEKHRLFGLMQTIASTYKVKLLRDYEGTSLDTLRHMVSTGLGIAFLPALYVRSEITPRRDVITVAFDGPAPIRSVVLAWRQNSSRSPMYRKIAETVRIVSRDTLSDSVIFDRRDEKNGVQ